MEKGAPFESPIIRNLYSQETTLYWPLNAYYENLDLDQGLQKDFYREASRIQWVGDDWGELEWEPYFQGVAKRLGVSLSAAVLLVALVDNTLRRNGEFRFLDLAEQLDCRPSFLFRLLPYIEELKGRGLIIFMAGSQEAEQNRQKLFQTFFFVFRETIHFLLAKSAPRKWMGFPAVSQEKMMPFFRHVLETHQGQDTPDRLLAKLKVTISGSPDSLLAQHLNYLGTLHDLHAQDLVLYLYFALQVKQTGPSLPLREFTKLDSPNQRRMPFSVRSRFKSPQHPLYQAGLLQLLDKEGEDTVYTVVITEKALRHFYEEGGETV